MLIYSQTKKRVKKIFKVTVTRKPAPRYHEPDRYENTFHYTPEYRRLCPEAQRHKLRVREDGSVLVTNENIASDYWTKDWAILYQVSRNEEGHLVWTKSFATSIGDGDYREQTIDVFRRQNNLIALAERLTAWKPSIGDARYPKNKKGKDGGRLGAGKNHSSVLITKEGYYVSTNNKVCWDTEDQSWKFGTYFDDYDENNRSGSIYSSLFSISPEKLKQLGANAVVAEPIVRERQTGGKIKHALDRSFYMFTREDGDVMAVYSMDLPPEVKKLYEAAIGDWTNSYNHRSASVKVDEWIDLSEVSDEYSRGLIRFDGTVVLEKDFNYFKWDPFDAIKWALKENQRIDSNWKAFDSWAEVEDFPLEEISIVDAFPNDSYSYKESIRRALSMDEDKQEFKKLSGFWGAILKDVVYETLPEELISHLNDINNAHETQRIEPGDVCPINNQLAVRLFANDNSIELHYIHYENRRITNVDVLNLRDALHKTQQNPLLYNTLTLKDVLDLLSKRTTFSLSPDQVVRN